MSTISVILADDHAIVRDGIKSLLESESDIQVIGEASNGLEAIDIVNQLHPDLLIVDIRMPKLNGIETAKKLKEAGSSTKCLMLTMHDDEEYVFRSIDSGASGYLLKDTGKDEFTRAIRTIAEGGKYFSSSISNVLVNNYLNQSTKPHLSGGEGDLLTKREMEILKMIVDGQTNKDISERFGKSIRTVETHRFKLMKKLKARNVVELINIAKEKGLG